MSSKYGGSSRASRLLTKSRRPSRDTKDISNQPSTDGSFSLGGVTSSISSANSNAQQQNKTNQTNAHNTTTNTATLSTSNIAAHTNNTTGSYSNQPLPHKMKRRPSPKRKREHQDPVHGLQTQFRSWDPLATDKNNSTFRRNVLGQPIMSPELVVQGTGQHRTPPFQTRAFSPTSANTDDTVTPSSIASGTPSPTEMEASPQALYSASTDRRRGALSNRSELGFSARAYMTIKDPSSRTRRKRRDRKDNTKDNSSSKREGEDSSSSSSSSGGPIAASHAIDFDTPSKSLPFDPRHSVPPRSGSSRRHSHGSTYNNNNNNNGHLNQLSFDNNNK